MMSRLTFLFFFCTIGILFQNIETKASDVVMSDSLRVRWIDGKKFLLHKVEPKQTWSSLAKKYNCTVTDLKEANNGVEELKIGQIINVPVITATENKSETGTKNTEKKPDLKESPKTGNAPVRNPSKEKTSVYHTVKQGETLYSISKSYNLTVDAVKTLNNLVSNSVKDGQKLLISNSTSNVGDLSPNATHVSPAPIKPEINQEIKQEKTNAAAAKPIKIETPPTPPPATTNNFERATKTISPIKKANGGKTLMQVTETGVATWLQDGQINQDKYYGLHRSAPIGTIMKVTNRMNNQFVYVKIVGVLPATGDNDNLIIKVSQAVSSKLNALDSLFQVELSYGVMQ